MILILNYLQKNKRYLDGLQKGLDKEIQEYKAKDRDNFDKKTNTKGKNKDIKLLQQKLLEAIVNGNIENINNLYKLGDDLVDYLLGDI